MQNRLVLTGIPSSITRLPNATDSLKELVEDHSCWVDRFAFLSNTTSSTDEGVKSCTVVGVELHIENVRDKAVQALDGLLISMDEQGDILDDSSTPGEASINCDTCNCNEHTNQCISFRIHAQRANTLQSAELIQKCPIESDDIAAEERMQQQTLDLTIPGVGCINFYVQRSKDHGGTGTFPWRGGLILATQFCHWAGDKMSHDGIPKNRNCIDFNALFHKKRVLELGAGSAGLPSLTLGKICNTVSGYEMDLIASDGIDEIVNALHVNIAHNNLQERVKVKHVDWNHYTNIEKSSNETTPEGDKADTIIFSDCIYNEECAIALSQTICNLLKQPGGNVIGILPDFRVGVDLFEKRMKESGFAATNIPIVAIETSDGFVCSGGGGKDYRLVWWR